jgi:metal-responsive CopG/Arc/MetJ family transcriptional regulator
MAEATALKFPERLNLQAPRGLGRALDEIAAKQHSTRSEVVRRVLLRELEANGLHLERVQA